ncbi:MAG: tRNA uridine-5-carboxymethylaminomethyl(34) synthesis enzyme MnmG, partial [Bacteroidia bacterium]
ILLRQDNADERLTEKACKLDMADGSRLERLKEKQSMVEEIMKFLRTESVDPERINEFLSIRGTSAVNQKTRAINLAGRPQIVLEVLLKHMEGAAKLEYNNSPRQREIAEAAEVSIKYSGYMERERNIAEKISRLENLKIPEDINYNELASVSNEGRQKLSKIRPQSIGQASRISGVSSSDISILIMYLGR